MWLTLMISTALAAEGMWLPEQLPGFAAELKAAGIRIPAETLGDPMGPVLGAVVSLGFCSGAFISSSGLIATNHHCVEEWLSAHATAERPLAHDGFLAKNMGEELPGPSGQSVYILESTTDVTAAILGSVKPDTADLDRTAAVERAQKEEVARCEKGKKRGPRRTCEVVDDWGGTRYRLLAYREIEDVRLVYAPPKSVGSFGGDRDNFDWPRHDGDFALLRAYVSGDKGAAVPFLPAHVLPIEPAGVAPGDAVLVAGFPGGTSRYDRASQLRRVAEVTFPARVAVLKQIEAVVSAEAAASPEAAARLSADLASVANSRKYVQGVLDNVAGSPVLVAKQQMEAELAAWVAADPARKQKYGAAIEELQRRADAWDQHDLQRLFRRFLRWSTLYNSAAAGYRLSVEREKPDMERAQGYQKRDEADLAESFERAARTWWGPADQALLRLLLTVHADLPPEQRLPELDGWLKEHGGVDAALSALYQSPALATEAGRRELLAAKRATLDRSTDPWLGLARALYPVELRAEAEQKAYNGALSRLMPVYMAALAEQRPGRVYPDANGTLRVTWGKLAPYSPRDAVSFEPQTTLGGLAEKIAMSDRYERPPEALVTRLPTGPKSRYADPKLGDVPVGFLSDLDTTGGNSGSATLNADGRFVGFVFDGNYESMAADWLYDPALTRSIHADVRYFLWTLEGLPDATWILRELGQAP